jgi:hypothetical protein
LPIAKVLQWFANAAAKHCLYVAGKINRKPRLPKNIGMGGAANRNSAYPKYYVIF